jgi:hypothetical protein
MRRRNRLKFGHDASRGFGGVTELTKTESAWERGGDVRRMTLPASHAVVKIAHFEKLNRRGERIER